MENGDPLFYLHTDCQVDATEGVYDLWLQNTTINYVGALHAGSAVQPDQSAVIYVYETSGIQTIESEKILGAVYNLQGQLVRPVGKSLSGLPSGVYIVNGKKILIAK